LHSLPEVPDGRYWKVDDFSRKFREAMEVLFVFKPEEMEREVRWFEEFEYGRAILQIHVEQVIDKPLKQRKEIYKRWRSDLGDEVARSRAKFAEYVIEHGRPKWFNRDLTTYPDTIVLKPSSLSTALPVSLSPSLQRATATQSSLL
jgi:phage/plasmid-associated DNA primase